MNSFCKKIMQSSFLMLFLSQTINSVYSGDPNSSIFSGELIKGLKIQKTEYVPLLEQPNRKKTREDGLEQTIIYSKDINRKNGYVIKKPGYYKLGENVTFKPRISRKDSHSRIKSFQTSPKVFAAITIQSSNVILDLGPYTLSQYIPSNPREQVPFVIGILVPDLAPKKSDVNLTALESIYINGTQAIIDGFSMYGIRVFGHTRDIKISNLTIKNTGALASLALRPSATYVPHSASEVDYGIPFGIAGLSIGESDTLGMGPRFFTQKSRAPQNRVKLVSIENVSCIENFFNGICVANTSDMTINNSHFDDTYSDDPGQTNTPVRATLTVAGGNFIGANNDIEFPNNLNLTITNSTFNNTNLIGDFQTVTNGPFPLYIATGAQFSRCVNVTCENSQFDNTKSSFVGGLTVGCRNSRVIDTTYLNCSFDQTMAITTPQGFHMSGSQTGSPVLDSSNGINIINCTANSTTQIGNRQLPSPIIPAGPLAGEVAGFAIYFAKNLNLENLTALDTVTNGPLSTPTIVSGIKVTSGSGVTPEYEADNTVLRNCFAARTTTVNGGIASGFCIAAGRGPARDDLESMVLEGCIAEGNQAFIPALSSSFPTITQGVAVGFFYQLIDSDNGFPVSYVNCKALRNRGAVSSSSGPLTFYSAGYFSYGLSGIAQKHTFYNSESTNNIYGFLLKNCSLFAVRQCRSDFNVDDTGLIGEGFTDVGATGTPALPGPSTSLFEFNHAFANGPGTNPAVGPNANYNIFYGPGQTLPVPILAGTLTGAVYPSSVTYRPADNISIIK